LNDLRSNLAFNCSCNRTSLQIVFEVAMVLTSGVIACILINHVAALRKDNVSTSLLQTSSTGVMHQLQQAEQWVQLETENAQETENHAKSKMEMLVQPLLQKLHLNFLAVREEPEQGAVAQPTPGQLLAHFIVTALIILAVAYLYTKNKPEFVIEEKADKASLDGDFKHGLFSCADTPGMSLFTFCCGGVRWADTMRMAGFLLFVYGVALWVLFESCSGLLGGLTWLFVTIVGTVYRQKLREAFKMPTGNDVMAKDCLMWCCCGCCAIVQEARQIEEAKALGHAAAGEELPLSFATSA